MSTEKSENKASTGSMLPSGIRSIDHASSGGLPAGSFVILFGKSGSGKETFMQTAALMNASMKQGILSKPETADVFLPDKIWYLAFAKTKEDVIRDVEISYDDELVEAFKETVQFEELMEDYYASTLEPLWGEGEPLEKENEEAPEIEIIKSIIEFAEKRARNSLILIDSLDDLIRAFPSGKENRLLAALRSVQSRNKNDWNSLILNDLTKNVFSESFEESIFSLADGVLDFESSSGGGAKKRTIRCRKFTGVPSELLDSNFEFQITGSGLEARRTELLES